MENPPFDDAQNRNGPLNAPKSKTWVMIETEHGCIDVTLDSLIEADEAFEKKLPMTRSEEHKNRVISNLMSRLWNETTPIPEAPQTADVSSPTWATAPSSSLEYSAYKKKIQASVSFESVVGKVNPYTGFKIKTQSDYELYCDFLLQQKISDARFVKANEKISQLEAELSSLRKNDSQSTNLDTPVKEAPSSSHSAPKPIITASPSQIPPRQEKFPPIVIPPIRNRRYRAGDHSYFIALAVFLILFWFLVIKS